MKLIRQWAALLSIILCIAALSPAQGEAVSNAGDITQEEALYVAREAFIDRYHISAGDLAAYYQTNAQIMIASDVNGVIFPRLWTVDFYYTRYADPLAELSALAGQVPECRVELSAASGDILAWSREADDFVSSVTAWDQQAAIRQSTRQWEQEKGDWRFWSYEDKAAFYAEYQAAPYGRANSSRTLQLPEENDLSYAQALATARQAVAAQLGASIEELDTLRLRVDFQGHYLYSADADYTNVWFFQFIDGEQLVPLYEAVIQSPSGVVLSVSIPDESAENPAVWNANIF